MITLNEAKKILEQNKAMLFSKYALKNLAIFGSVANGELSNESDVDILVEFLKPVGLEFIDLANELELLLNRRVDLVSKNGIKKQYFESIEKDLIYV